MELPELELLLFELPLELLLEPLFELPLELLLEPLLEPLLELPLELLPEPLPEPPPLEPEPPRAIAGVAIRPITRTVAMVAEMFFRLNMMGHP
jgi:hypothetical protein